MNSWLIFSSVAWVTLLTACCGLLVLRLFGKGSALLGTPTSVLPAENTSLKSSLDSLEATLTKQESRLKQIESEWADTYQRFDRLSKRLYRQAGHDHAREDRSGATNGAEEVVQDPVSRRDILKLSRRQ